MSDFYVSSVTGEPIAKEQAQSKAKELGVTLDEYLDSYNYELALPNEADTDNNVVDNTVPEYVEPEPIALDPNTPDPSDQMFDAFELEPGEQELQDENLINKRTAKRRELFDNIEEEEAVSLLKSYFPDFKFEEATVWASSTGFPSTDAVRVTSPDGENSIKLELDIGDFDIDPYMKNEDGTPYSHIDGNYEKLKKFIKEHSVDVEGTLAAQANIGDTEIGIETDVEVFQEGRGNVPNYTRTEKQVTSYKTVAEIYNTSHLEGGAKIDDSDITAINEKYKYDPTTGTYDLSIFDTEKRKRTSGGYASPTTGIVTGSSVVEYDYQPYEAQLEATRKQLTARSESSDYEFTEEDVKKFTAMNMRSQDISEKKAYVLEQFIDSQPESTQGIMQAYNLQESDKAQKESIKKSVLAENKLNEAVEKQKFMEGYIDWYQNPNQTWDFPDDYQGEVIQLANGKITPKDQYLNFINFSQQHADLIKEANSLQKEAHAAADQVADREAQWDLLRRDYNVWSKSGANIALGTTDILVGGAYMAHKLARFIPGVGLPSILLDDIVDDAAADYYGWSQEAREDYQRDIKFEDAFSDGNFGEFFMAEMSKQIPILASIIASGGTYAPYVVGTYSGGQEWMRLEHSNKYYGTDYGEGEMFMRSVGYGAAESVLGTLPTVWILGRGSKIMTQKFGQEWIKGAGKQYRRKMAGETLLASPMIEAGSEALTSLSQNMISYAAGDLHYSQLTQGMDHAGFVGGLMGLTLGGSQFAVGAATASITSSANLEQILDLQERYRNLEDKTSPEAKQVIRDMDELYRAEKAKLDNIDEEGKRGYDAATRLQAEILAEAREIEASDKSNKQKQKELKGKLDKFNSLQFQRDTYRNKDSFGNAFAVLETNDKDLYDELRQKAIRSFDGKTPTEDQIKETMEKLYYDDRVDKQIEKDVALNNKLGKSLNIVDVEGAVKVVRDVINSIKNNKDNLDENGKLTKEKQDQINQLEQEINSIRQGTKNGFYKKDGDNKTKYLIPDNMKKNQKVYTGVHELGHDVFEDMAINDPTFFDDMSDAILDYTSKANPGLYNRLLVRSKAKGSEELVMEFLEDVAEGRVNLEKEGYLSGILGYVVNKKSDTPIPFQSKQDTIEWLTSLAKKLKDGDINKTALKKDIADARRQRKGDRVKKKITDKDVEIKSSDSQAVTDIYNEKGINGAFEIIEKYRGMANKLANKYREVPGYETYKDDLIQEILTGERGVYGMITKYNPKSGVPLAAYINKYIKSRTIEAANKILKTNFELDVSEARGVAAAESEVSIDNQVQRNSKLRRQLNIPNAVITKIKAAVEKTFGTRLPDVNSKDFKKSLQDSYRTELFKTIKNLIGTRTKFKNYLDKNFEAIYKALPQSVINKRFKPFAENTGKREKTPQGNAIFKKKNITKEEFINYFLGDNVGNSTKGTRKDALAEALAQELAFDATMEIVQSPEVRQRRAMIAELDGNAIMDNDIAVIAKQIDRDPSVKFSDMSVPKGVDPKSYIEKEFIPQSETLAQLVRDKGYEEVYGNSLLEQGFNKDVWKFVDKLIKEGKIDSDGNVKWKAWAKNSPIKEVNVLYDVVKERGALTNKSSKTLRDNYLKDVKILAKDLGSDIMNLFGKDMELLGFVYRLLDPAENKNDGTKGQYFKDKESLKKDLKSKLNLPFEVDDVRLMNIKFDLFKKIQKILSQDANRKKKLDQIKELQTEIDNANIANIELGIHIAKSMAKGKMSDIGIYDMLQAQSNIVGGLKGTSRLDFIQILDGPQAVGKNYTKHPKYKEVKKFIQEKFPDKTAAEVESAVKSVLKPKGEHVGAWLKTAQKIADAIFNFRYNKKGLSKAELENRLDKELREAYKDHTQYLTDIFDTKAIDKLQIIKGKVVIAGSTSGKALARLENTVAEGIFGESRVERAAKLRAEYELGIKFSSTGNTNNYVNVKSKLDLINAVRALQANPNQPQKGISVLDFDDTLANTNSQVIVNMPDGTTKEINATEFALQSATLEAMGAEFDFSQFNQVIDGKKGPFYNKAKSLKDKFGNTDIFVLTARPQAAASAIHAFMKGIGLEIPIENITGLENGTADAKAMWILDKAANGYNDFLFADDAIKNVKAVKQILDAVDVKSKVYQAGRVNQKGQPNLKFSETSTQTKSDILNKMIQDKKGISAKARYSDAVAKLKGSKVGGFKFYLPPSAQDFALALYNFLPKGKQGNAAWKFFLDTLIKPYNRGVAALDIAREQVGIDYDALLKDFKNVKKNLNKEVPNSAFTYQQAVRVYLWQKAGFNIPGIAKRDLLSINRIMKADPELKAFADKLSKLTGIKEGYVKPGEHWVAESILSDLASITDKVGRAQFLKEFTENVDEVFDKDNLNKIEAIFGKALRDSLEDSIYRMKTGSNRQFGSNKQLNDFMMWINNSVGATMFINFRSATLQSLSLFNYINYGDNNIFKAAAAFANLPNYVKHVVKIFNSPKLKQRRAGLKLNVQEAEMAEAANSGGFKGMLAYLLKIGFTPTRAVDSLAIATGGATFLINRTKTYIKQGMPKAEAEAKAFEDFSEVTERNQQSADPSKISPLQAGPLGRTVFAWQNTPFQYNRVMKMAGLDLVNRRITPPYKTQYQSDMSNIGKIVYYGALQNFIFNAMQTGLFALFFDEDDLADNEKQLAKEYGQKFRAVNQMGDTILRGSGLPGAIVSTIKNILLQYHAQEKKGWNADHTYTLIEAINMSPTLGSKARLMYSGIQTYKFEKDVINARGLALDSPLWDIIGAETQAATNIPLSKAILLLRNIQGSLQERHATWQRVAVAMGWPYYQMNMELYPEHEDIKAQAKEVRKEQGKIKAKETRERNKKIKDAAEAFILDNMSWAEEDEYYDLSGKERRAWMKKKVDEYLNNQENK